ncbi:hypothetical protein BaRGS_00023712, partial [Batillaria attramentaria]
MAMIVRVVCVSGQGGDVRLPAGVVEEFESRVSSASTRLLLIDDGQDDGWTFEDHVEEYRQFQCRLLGFIEKYTTRKSVPLFCLLINGDENSLKTVLFALETKVPVILMKGSGGFADVIADVWQKASDEVENRRDESGSVRARITKKAGEAGHRYLEKHASSSETVRLLRDVFKHLDFISLYYKMLDSAIFEAFNRNNKTQKVRSLLTMGIKQRQENLATAAEGTERSFDMSSKEWQMNFLLEAMKKDSVDTVIMLLEELDISPLHERLSLDRLSRLVSTEPGLRREGSWYRREFRGRLQQHLKKLPLLPLSCSGVNCSKCATDDETDEHGMEEGTREDIPLQTLNTATGTTCLVAKQELFLWAVDTRRIKMALAVLGLCKDRVAAALFAQAVFKGMSESGAHPTEKKAIEEHAKLFQEIAVQTVKCCHEMREGETEYLLTKPCEWWGGVSVLQLAILTENKAFLAQSACQEMLTHIWRGDRQQQRLYEEHRIQPLLRVLARRPYRFLDTGLGDADCDTGLLACCSPQQMFAFNFFMRIGFLVLLSYEVLSHFQHSEELSPSFITLFAWMTAITVEKIRQIRDTFNFMVILLVVVMGYAVSSESLLYPVSATSAESLYHMPRKAYWQVFGELFLDEIENTGDAGCALLNSNQTDDNVMTLCTTMSFAGRHVVPVFLGVYIMITNVLLLNLLIARFNKTFENVLDSAEEHLSWQRCQSVQFYHSKFVPPPFNIITGAVCLVTKLWKTCRRSQEEHFVREDQRDDAEMQKLKDEVDELEAQQVTWVLQQVERAARKDMAADTQSRIIR